MQASFNHLKVKKSLKKFAIIFLLVTIICTNPFETFAQATLSLQGILKKANGTALEDGTYSIKFNIYAVDGSPSGILWDEVNPNVELNGGIYSVILGEIEDLDLPFNQDYELGVQIGSQEMTPRIRLTSAPYALALRGSTNQFPSSGPILADTIRVAGGVIANTGAPLVTDVDGGKGYSFKNDNDSGLFSTGNGETSIYTNGVEKIEVQNTSINLKSDTVNASGVLTSSKINIYNNGGINYSTSQGSFQGWRLADVDDLNTLDGWQEYSQIGPEFVGWNSSNASNPCLCGAENGASGTFLGNFLLVNDRNNVLKKQFNISGTFSQIKVKFRYVAVDSWDAGDFGFAGFATDVSGSNFKVAWLDEIISPVGGATKLNTVGIKAKTQFRGNTNFGDHWIDAEMTARANGNSFWVFVGAAMEGDADETFGLGPIEIWVR